MHSVQCFHAQHEVLHAQHEMSFKGSELFQVFHKFQMPIFTTLSLLLTNNAVDNDKYHMGIPVV